MKFGIRPDGHHLHGRGGNYSAGTVQIYTKIFGSQRFGKIFENIPYTINRIKMYVNICLT